MLGHNLIGALESCEPGCEDGGEPCEMREALRYLLSASERYGAPTEPLTPLRGSSKPRRFLALMFRMRRGKRSQKKASVIAGFEMASESSESTIAPATESELYSRLTREILSRATSGSLIVTTGRDSHILDAFLGQFGERLVEDGYAIQPLISGSSISCLRISRREGRETWTVTYAETVTGVKLSTLVGYAKDAGYVSASGSESRTSILWSALDAYQNLTLETFGVALNQTAGMTAMQSARHCLPDDFKKWRPDPLLVAMERMGRGYRGGMTYGTKYRGPSLRIDVVRQYTNALRAPLPYESSFGRYVSETETPHGVFVCHVRFPRAMAYPLSVWDRSTKRFRSGTGWVGEHVCVLHTTELPGLRLQGVTITPWYGFVFTRVFSLGGFVDRIQSLLDLHGYGSNLSKLLKPIGNYVYGKFGQNPKQQELRYSKSDPGRSWYPYVDADLKAWTNVWTKDTKRFTSSQHVEIAGAITGAARSQTLQMWHQCVTSGLTVIRCHTDSLTVADLTEKRAYIPAAILDQLTASEIGRWRVECLDADTIVVAANAYSDSEGVHIAGISEPTREMLTEVLGGNVVFVTQQQQAPLRGYERGAIEVTKRFG